MSCMYTKLFGSIVHSTIWREADHVRLVWITMLALADKNGCVWAAVPGLADAARVTVEQCRDAVERLSGPDPDSRTQVADGRRIEPIDGGWFLINHAKFQAIKNMDERRDAVRLAVQRHRAKEKDEAVINVIIGNQGKSDVITVSPSDQTNSTNTKPKRTTTPSVRTPTEDEKRVMSHYLTVHPLRKASPKAYKAAGRALASGYSPDELCAAIDGNAADAWHKKHGKHELTYVLRDEEKIDGFKAKGLVAKIPTVDPLTGCLTPEGYARIMSDD